MIEIGTDSWFYIFPTIKFAKTSARFIWEVAWLNVYITQELRLK